MKLLVFAHVPPPHHGQSYMVQLMLNGFGGDCRKSRNKSGTRNGYDIDCYHVDARFSKSLTDIGELQIAKLPLILFYCLQAIWCRFRYGVTNFYYVPAPSKSIALYRDWLVMFICRPFFKHIILHWHAAGLAKWLETSTQIRTRALTYRVFKPVDLSIVLSKHVIADAEKLLSQRICILNHGIPDPCPDFKQKVLPRRRARFALRARLLAGQKVSPAEMEAAGSDPQIIKVFYLAHCMREKGLFDALEGVVRAEQKLKKLNIPMKLQLSVAGEFVNRDEKFEFVRRVEEIEADSGSQLRIHYLGFVSGEAKARAFIESDCFCFPTYYYAESFGLVVVEAMAFGLPVVTTRWRSLPEILPPNYPGLVSVKSPGEIADVLIKLTTQESGETLRDYYQNHFTLEVYLKNLAKAFHSVESAADGTLKSFSPAAGMNG